MLIEPVGDDVFKDDLGTSCTDCFMQACFVQWLFYNENGKEKHNWA